MIQPSADGITRFVNENSRRRLRARGRKCSVHWHTLSFLLISRGEISRRQGASQWKACATHNGALSGGAAFEFLRFSRRGSRVSQKLTRGRDRLLSSKKEIKRLQHCPVQKCLQRTPTGEQIIFSAGNRISWKVATKTLCYAKHFCNGKNRRKTLNPRLTFLNNKARSGTAKSPGNFLHLTSRRTF